MQPSNQPTLADVRRAVGRLMAHGDHHDGTQRSCDHLTMRDFAAAMLPAIEALAAELDADADAERRSGRITPQPVRLRLHAAARRVVEAANNKGTL